jgi:DNA-binding HxlR family transcriptional regulator
VVVLVGAILGTYPPGHKYLPRGKYWGNPHRDTYPEVSTLPPGRYHVIFARMAKHQPPNVFAAACPSRRVMAVLAEKWTLLIVTQLAKGPMRTAEIRRQVDGISEKMLIQTLRKLESYGLVSRRSYPEIPPRVDYRLTPLGRSLARLGGLFSRWVERNVAHLLKAQSNAA